MFDLTKEQWEKFEAWSKEQDEKTRKQQEGTELEHKGEAYYGAIGGAYTYSFTPNTLGCTVKVKNAVTGEEIDLTDYDSW